jgi:endonuclease YncB( thermonuclease family)
MNSTVRIFMATTIAATLLLAAGASSSRPREIEIHGEVVAIMDGDTFTLLVDGNRQVKIRLTEIDTPEHGQPYSQKSRQELSDLVFGREVRIQSAGQDRYGRMLGRVFVDEVDVNAELVRRGAAWAYRKYAKDPLIIELEHTAREARRGIWALPEAERIPPWEWRRRRR